MIDEIKQAMEYAHAVISERYLFTKMPITMVVDIEQASNEAVTVWYQRRGYTQAPILVELVDRGGGYFDMVPHLRTSSSKLAM
jgi:hypothetical protein